MAADEVLLARVRDAMRTHDQQATEKPMFGGTGFMVNGNLACSVRDRLMARIGEAAADEAAAADPHVELMIHGGRRMKDYVFVDKAALGDDEAVGDWVGKSLEFVATLPPKGAKG